ncbi:hypothetical protein [Pontimicrobium sp. MEBiC01747]
MIYFLFIISVLIYLGLRLSKFYYDYLEVEYKAKDNKLTPKFNVFTTLKLFLLNIFQKKRINWKLNHSKSHKWRYAIIKSLSEFFAIFIIVSFIFSLFQLWLDSTTNIEYAKSTILQIEHAQHKIKETMQFFSISSGYEALILIVLIICISSFPFLESLKLKKKFQKLNKLLKLLLLFFTVSTSFTFFGNRLNAVEQKRIANLKIHKLQIIENNTLLYSNIREKVKEIVINEILLNENIEDVLSKTEAIKPKLDAATDNDDYEDFNTLVPEHIINKLNVNVLKKTLKPKFNFSKVFYYGVNKYSKATKTSTTKSSSTIYEEFKRKNTDWSENKHTASDVDNATKKYKNARSANNIKYSKFYRKYKEPLSIIIKNIYEKTGKKWVNGLLEILKTDIPFLENFIDPIIHEPIEEFINNKTELLFKKAFNSTEESIKADIKNCAKEFSNSFNTQANNNAKLKALNKELTKDLKKVNKASKNTVYEIKAYHKKVDRYLNTLSSKSRWENLRKDFRKRINKSNLGFKQNQMQHFKTTLDDWETYKKSNKYKWYNTKIKSLEDQFFNYSKSNNKLKACWGYILQQQDWEGSVYYYKYIAPEKGARGNPYYLLKYYYNSTGKSGAIEKLYTKQTNEWVGILCPPH